MRLTRRAAELLASRFVAAGAASFRACAAPAPRLLDALGDGRRHRASGAEGEASASAAGTDGAAPPPVAYPVWGACLLERMPVVWPKPEPWQEFHYAKLAAKARPLPKELVEPKATADASESTALWAPAAVEEAPTHPRAMERRPEEYVYLLVRDGAGRWAFPAAPHAPGETIRQVASRALSESLLPIDAHFIGNAPAAHHPLGGGAAVAAAEAAAAASGRPAAAAAAPLVFYLRAAYLGGDVAPRPGGGVADWAWVAAAELPAYLTHETEEVLALLRGALP